jgi:hypothetical protein
MSLKSKIITKLKEKAKELGVNLSNVRINGLADKLDGILENEDDIDAEIDKLDQVLGFKELAQLDDAKRNADKKAAEDADKGKGGDPDPVDPKPADPSDKDKDETPAWAQALIDTNKALQAEVAAIKAGNTTSSRRSTLEAKLKDAPEKFKARTLRDFDRLKLETDEDFTNYLADIEQDVADEIQAQSDAGLGGDAPVGGIGGGGKGTKEASQAEIDAIAETLNI